MGMENHLAGFVWVYEFHFALAVLWWLCNDVIDECLHLLWASQTAARNTEWESKT